MHSECDGVVECTALVLAESCTEFEDRLTLFGILDEIRPNGDGETSFVVYTKFEGCEHASDKERQARIIVTDEEGETLMESAEYSVYLDGTEEPVTIVAAFDLPDDFEVAGSNYSGSRPSSTTRPSPRPPSRSTTITVSSKSTERPGDPGLSHYSRKTTYA